MSTVVVTSSAQLSDYFKYSAQDGDRIELAAGDYSAVTLQDRNFAQGITITSHDPNARAVFAETLDLFNTSGVTVVGVDVVADEIASSTKVARVSISSSSDITLSDVLIKGHIPTTSEGSDPLATGTQQSQPIAGYGYETGLRIRSSQNITVEHVELTDLRGGISLTDVKDSTITEIDLHDVREGIDLNDIQNLIIENSYIHDLNPWQQSDGVGDHPDMIQYWGVNSSYGINGLTIQGNLFYQPADSKTQTVFGSMHPERSGLTASNFTITDNVIINAQTNAIRLDDVDGVNISGNVLLPNDDNLDFRSYPSIYLGDVTNGIVADNMVMSRWLQGDVLNMTQQEQMAANITTSGNVIMSENPGSPLFWHTIRDETLAKFADQTWGTTGQEANPDPDPVAVPDAAPIILAPYDVPTSDTRSVITGTDSKNTLTADTHGSYLFGFDGNDTLKSGSGHDYLVGAAGADTFYFDYQASTNPQDDVIADLNFGEGDVLRLIGSMVLTIDDSFELNNNIQIFQKYQTATFDSLADLREAVNGGSVTATAGDSGQSLLLSFAASPQYTIEILNLTLDDIL